MTPTKKSAANEAHDLFLNSHDGVLSTLSKDVPGYPFGSVVPFCIDRAGNPLVLVAGIAQHTRNMSADPRVSLIAFEREAPDWQAAGRLTLVADAEPVAETDEDTAERYFRYFPEAREYRRTHDFGLWRLVPKRARYIGGFGKIHWFEPADVVPANPFEEADERHMIDHMNKDHVAAMRNYCVRASVELDCRTIPAMVGVDAAGFHLRLGSRLVRFRFPAPVSSPMEVRKVLVEMARS